MSTQTPWGKATYRDIHFKGCTTFCTASHGGVHISSTVYPYISDYTKEHATQKGPKGYWYEEDMDYILPLYELYKVPKYAKILEEAYKKPTLEQVKSFFPDYPEADGSMHIQEGDLGCYKGKGAPDISKVKTLVVTFKNGRTEEYAWTKCVTSAGSSNCDKCTFQVNRHNSLCLYLPFKCPNGVIWIKTNDILEDL